MILLLAGLFALGVYLVVYSLNLFGYRLGDLLNPLSSFASSLRGFVRGVESGNLPLLTIVTLVLIALLGLILLIAELKPPAPRRVRMRNGTYTTRDAVRNEVVTAAGETPGVLGSSARVKARRRQGAQVNLEANVRHGEDRNAIQSDLRNSVRERLGRRGVPVSKLNVKVVEADPRRTETRVR